MCKNGVLPSIFDMRRPPRNDNEIPNTRTKDLIGYVNISTLSVASLGRGQLSRKYRVVRI